MVKIRTRRLRLGRMDGIAGRGMRWHRVYCGNNAGQWRVTFELRFQRSRNENGSRARGKREGRRTSAGVTGVPDPLMLPREAGITRAGKAKTRNAVNEGSRAGGWSFGAPDVARCDHGASAQSRCCLVLAPGRSTGLTASPAVVRVLKASTKQVLPRCNLSAIRAFEFLSRSRSRRVISEGEAETPFSWRDFFGRQNERVRTGSIS